jgi:hypothetical protein
MATKKTAARRAKPETDASEGGGGRALWTGSISFGLLQAPVSMPVAWDELGHVEALDFTVRTVPGFLASRKSDPWKKFDAARRPLPEEMP